MVGKNRKIVSFSHDVLITFKGRHKWLKVFCRMRFVCVCDSFSYFDKKKSLVGATPFFPELLYTAPIAESETSTISESS